MFHYFQAWIVGLIVFMIFNRYFIRLKASGITALFFLTAVPFALGMFIFKLLGV